MPPTVLRHLCFPSSVCSCSLSQDRLFATLETVAHQAPLSAGISRQEYWNRLPALLQGIFSTQGSNPHLLCLLHCRQILYPYTRWYNSLSFSRGSLVNYFLKSLLLLILIILVYVCSVVKLCLTLATPWTVAHQAPLPIGWNNIKYLTISSVLTFKGLAWLATWEEKLQRIRPGILSDWPQKGQKSET